MKNIRIFEPAMCCATGLCGPSIDPELLRISTLLSSLKEKGIVVERYNLTSHPQVFAQNEAVKELLSKHGTAILPVTISGDDVVLTGRYPTNQQVFAWMQVDAQDIQAVVQVEPERAVPHFFEYLAVRCRNDPHIGTNAAA